MGYTTDFYGDFSIVPEIKPEHRAYINQFSTIRHMKRDPSKLIGVPDPLREAVGLPIGLEGEYFVGELDKVSSQGFGWGNNTPDPSAESILDTNNPPTSQPGLWCQWIVNGTESCLEWDEGEKFYSYVEWLKYLIKHFFNPWGYSLAGEVEWQGEERDDMGLIRIDSPNNEVIVLRAQITWVPR